MKNIGRKPLIGGNWKMHFLRADATNFCRSLLAGLSAPQAEVVIFPSFPLLDIVVSHLRGSTIACGGQDLHTENQGAFTGDVAGAQLVDAGCRWVLCGHSERRRDHAESDEVVGAKAAAANRHGLTPMICIGETLEERQAGETEAVLARQLDAALTHRPEPFAIAYEPVWAIGTGETATPEIAQATHRYIRDHLADLVGDDAAASKRIVYGGSANPENVAQLFAEPDIDGFLVGGASLDPEKFLAIIRTCGSSD